MYPSVLYSILDERERRKREPIQTKGGKELDKFKDL
jgi:hypothetical protein